ncbi:MAG: transcription factor TFIIIC subunit tfc4 [Claussenomyces sp. TS43310]|nr:MAG: transcription factor TFIIIC subunit tfc4 [Claussenomyces sp. TS43310]
MEQFYSSQPRTLSYKSPYPDLDQQSTFVWSGHTISHNDSHDPLPRSKVERSEDFKQISSLSGDTLPRHQNDSEQHADATVSALRASKGQHSPAEHDDDDFLHGPGYSDLDEDELSEADSDYLTLRTNIAKFKDSVRKFRAEQSHQSDEGSFPGTVEDSHKRGKRRATRGKSIARGPRKAAEPTGDIKFRLGQASQAFIEERYEDAREIVFEVIRINAETYEAWTLLASIWKELGDLDKTVMTLMYAAHLRPKEVAVWLNCARFALEETGGDRAKYLASAKFCYASAIRADPKNDVEARLGKAEVLQELGNCSSALSEYKQVLKKLPHDTKVLRHMAEIHIDQDNVEEAKALYKRSIAFYRAVNDPEKQAFDWSDVNIYVELYGYLGHYSGAIKELKSLARWLLGRQDQTYWDEITQNDCEWDLDHTRRAQVTGFVESQHELHQYGKGLPIELRIKLGLYRLQMGQNDEAMMHFLWLDPRNESGENRILDYPDLFREVASSLSEAGAYEDALAFYEALSAISEQDDLSILLPMGKCYANTNRVEQAEECLRMLADLDAYNIEARMQLAKLYEAIDDQEQAFFYINEVFALRRRPAAKHCRTNSASCDPILSEETLVPARASRKSYYKPKRGLNSAERQREEILRAERLQEQYSIMCLQHSSMRSGLDGPTRAWMDAARDLIEDFRGFRTFYPLDKYLRFLGYTTGVSQTQPETGAVPLDADFAAMANRVSNRLGSNAESSSNGPLSSNVPENYRGIPFPVWLDIFLQYALCLVRYGRFREAYEICGAARDAVVWYHSREDMFLIHVCWCACAVLANDEETCLSTCRYFMKEGQFTTDSYRMFAALGRLTQSPISWYNSGPTQKYILRQIKAMDSALTSSRSRHMSFSDMHCARPGEAVNATVGNDVDVCLLMVYGHILYSGASYAYALNYFLRAYAVDPGNSLISMSIGLGYIHYGLKRQAENRQYHVMQGMTFLLRYYDSRCSSSAVEERQEAHYNMARTYHLLGLTHLALTYYSRVLLEVQGPTPTRDDLVRDAAFNLQTLYALGGNPKLAKAVSDSWLSV